MNRSTAIAWLVLQVLALNFYLAALLMLPRGPWWRLASGAVLVMCGVSCQRAARSRAATKGEPE